MADLDLRDRRQDIGLKNVYACVLLAMLGGQFFVTNVVFIVYAWAGRDWKVPDAVINGWLAATVVELVGIVAVVTRYLFPNRDREPTRNQDSV
jgi:formate/nitrite transporter FocA (FNT family)